MNFNLFHVEFEQLNQISFMYPNLYKQELTSSHQLAKGDNSIILTHKLQFISPFIHHMIMF